MGSYQYTAKDPAGREFSGTYEDVDGVGVLRKELARMGYALTAAHRVKRKARQRKIRPSDVVAFAYKFAGMYSAGLTILDCLETLEEQDENPAFRSLIADIKEKIETGVSLKDAFGEHRKVFSDFFIGMIEAGETGGKLSQALEMRHEYLEKRLEIRRKVRSAFTYPIVVSIVCLAVLAGLLVFVVPVFVKIYKQLHVVLPGPTQALVVVGDLIRNRWWALCHLVLVAVILLRRARKSDLIRAKWDTFKLDIPVFGKLNRMIIISHFTRTFAMLASVGVSIIDALETASQVAGNHRLKEISKELQDTVRAGNPLGSSLKNYDLFPPMIVQLAVSGEQAGILPDMLNKGADFLDKDIDRVTHALLIKLEPILTVVMGIVVGLILMAVYLPMFDFMAQLE